MGRWILDFGGVTEGCLRVKDGIVVELARGPPPTESSKAIVLPGFVNAHTHVGDSFAYPAPRGTLEELVAPPNGYKHRALRSATRERKLAGMRSAVDIMKGSGTSAFVDFREEGVQGLGDLAEALKGHTDPPQAVVLGRPNGPEISEEDLRRVLSGSDGLGMSALRDWGLSYLEAASRAAHSAGKRFALHASEAVREDIDAVMKLDPDFLVHMCNATDEDLAVCASRRVPIVVCPRSNEFFGIDLDIPRMMRSGVDLALGTDNGMIARPDMLEEIRAAYRIGRRKGQIAPLDILRLATFGGRKVLNAPAKITPEIGIQDDLAVIRLRGEEDPLLELCMTSVSTDVEATVKGGRVRRSGVWR